MLARLGLRLRVLLFFAALAAGCIGAVALGLTVGAGRLAGLPEAARTAFVQAGLIAGFVILGLIAWVWFLFDQNVARAIETVSAAIRARAHAEVDGEIDTTPARYLGDLAPAVAAALRTLAETRNALAEAVARETTRLATEKGRLEALLSDVPVGVLLCTADHQLVFYNGQAVDLLGAAGAPGLDRNLFDYLREGPVRHAFQRLMETDDPDAASDLLCATAAGARVLAGRMRLLVGRGEGGLPGYVLTLRDVTADLAAHARREQLLAEIIDRVRRPAANLQTVVAALEAGGTAPGAEALNRAMLQEVTALTRAVVELAARYDEGRSEWWPLALTRGSDLLDSLRARIEAAGLAAEAEAEAAPLLLRCNGFEIVALLATLAERVAGAGLARSFRLALAEDGTGAMLSLEWQGAALAVGRLDGWLVEPLEVGVADVSGRTVLHNHATECWPERLDAGRAAIRLPIPRARRAGRRPPPVARAVVYDFDLLSKARNDRVADSRLEDLTYVVFDTETTGLSPVSDEIVQLAAVRIVNGRRVEGETLDLLVNPGRSIPPGSTDVHGITDAMVAEAPAIGEAGRRFHRFAAGAVLVAHNAPFDMEFLRRHEGAIGASFDNPILDTVLLSAVVFGQQEAHSLDALAARLGITIPEEVRHTALGDTVATAEALLRLLPMLRARGLASFGAVLTEVRRHGRLLRDLN